VSCRVPRSLQERRPKPSEYCRGLVCGHGPRNPEILIVAIVRFHIDESGGVDTRSFAMGGYTASVKTWESFSDDWQATLERSPKIPALHMVDCERLRDGFEVLDDGTREQRLRDRKLHDLVKVIRRHKPIVARVVRWRSADFNTHVRGQMPRRMRKLNTPHAWGCFTLLSQLGHENQGLQEFGRDALECIFDWHQESGPRSRTEYENLVRPELERDFPQFGAIGVRWPLPEERWQYPALQAADMLVWHIRRALDYPDGKHRQVYKELMRATKIANRKITATQMRKLIAAGYETGP
jgi:hypothetical protein